MEGVAAALVILGATIGAAPTQGAAKLLRTLLTNISNNPSELKFRRIRTTNPKIAVALSVKGSRELLAATGFATPAAEPEHLVLGSSTTGPALAAATAGLDKLLASAQQQQHMVYIAAWYTAREREREQSLSSDGERGSSLGVTHACVRAGERGATCVCACVKGGGSR